MTELSNQPQAGEDTVHYHMHITDVRRGPRTPEGYEPVIQETTRGPIEMRYYPAAGTMQDAIFVGGAGGGFDSPVRGSLYPQLCTELQGDGIAGLRVRYRLPVDLEECVMDVLAGISFLEADHITSIAVVGHSFGGAVVIQAAALSPDVRTCVALATQTYGTDPVGRLGPRCSLLLAHGLDDQVLPPDCSRQVYRAAREPKRLLLKAHVGHGLDEWADELPGIIHDWIRKELARPAPPAQ
ncbi:MAG: dienelactone hydrolase [Phycisphaerales bacterium]|nr:dienelactone hydrolase [Phycisphaerales bacterium]